MVDSQTGMPYLADWGGAKTSGVTRPYVGTVLLLTQLVSSSHSVPYNIADDLEPFVCS